MDESGNPQQLSSTNQAVFNELSKLDDNELWLRIKPYAIISYNSKFATTKNRKASEEGLKFFSSEFSGTKKKSERLSSEFQVYHGFIVESLKEYVELKYQNSIVYNTQKIDLAREEKGILRDVYEVKTSTDTQSIYTAVGQLFMHTAGKENIWKWIVLPDSSDNQELIECLEMLSIKIIWFSIVGKICNFNPHNSMLSSTTTPIL